MFDELNGFQIIMLILVVIFVLIVIILGIYFYKNIYLIEELKSHQIELMEKVEKIYGKKYPIEDDFFKIMFC